MLKHSAKEFIKNPIKEKHSGFYLGADIGGTYSRFAVAGIKEGKPQIIFVLNFETSSTDSIIPLIKKTLSYADKKYHINVRAACIGLAGIISDSKDFVELTNAEWSISKKEIIDETYLQDVFLINDFKALGYGVNFLEKDSAKDVYQIRKGNSSKFETKALIGAGTGLGKSILTYHKNLGCYVPISSEGGNSDFPYYNEFESSLVEYIKEIRNISKPLVYEEILSGRGIEGIYQFLCKKNNEEIKYSSAELISKHRKKDKNCKQTFELFSKFYARCAKNFALDTLCKGGIYIAGGITAKNKEIFESEKFISEFNKGNRREDFLRNVPLYIILNQYTGLLGACYAARLKCTEEE